MSCGQGQAFGVDGHRIIASIADNHLSEKTRRAVARIGDGESLTELALWPDQIRGAPEWRHSKSWHYINIQDHETFAALQRNPKGDLLSALKASYQQLQDASLTKQKRREALAFFVHFVGDIHQPLHVGRYSDLGGNRVSIKWPGDNKRRNLHWAWDSGLIKHEQLTVEQYSALINKATAQQISNWQTDGFLDWARESKIVRAQVYEFGPLAKTTPAAIGQNYIERNKPLLKKRLLMAGIRVAGCLNRIFDGQYFGQLAVDKKGCEVTENLE